MYLQIWQDASVDRIHFFNDVLPAGNVSVTRPKIESGGQIGSTEEVESDSNVGVDDQEQLLGGVGDGDVEAPPPTAEEERPLRRRRRRAAAMGLPPDQLRPRSDPHDPPRDWNATNNLTYGSALGTLALGTKNVMNVEYESLNYLTLRNGLFEEYEKRTVCKKSIRRLEVMRFLVAGMIGLMTGLIGAFIKYGIEACARPKYELFAFFLNKFSTEEAASKSVNLAAKASAVILAVNGGLVCLAGVFGNMVPVSTGSGIPHIKAYLNGVNVPKLLRIETLACKVMGVITSVVGGMPVGKEGPMIHSGMHSLLINSRVIYMTHIRIL